MVGSARLTVALGVAVSLAWAIAIAPRARANPDGIPKLAKETSYVGSSACLGCHPGEHASFSRTFHRTMTQEANAKTVLAPFERRGDEVRTSAGRVVMTTGSHRQQAYWVKGDRPGDLRLVPEVWLVKEKRLIPRQEAFLTPPDNDVSRARWSSSCIACHVVAGEPRHEPARDGFDTRVAELGVTCEACHGPGAAHVARHRDPFERIAQRKSKSADPTIVHPAKIAKARSAAVCGQCHSYAFPRDEDEWWTSGYAKAFRAGDTLDASRFLLTPKTTAVRVETEEDTLFWPDGTIRVGGREYNGMVLSACFTRGEMTCLSCHAMHRGDPQGQIAPDRMGDAACNHCHAGTKEHSKHAEGSPGRACVACHMPKTSYALLSAVRSHRIEIPRTDGAKPSACDLCHLDRVDHGVPWGARAALAGDAAVRVLVADALGSPEAPIPMTLRAQLLSILREDPYAAVRHVAQRSLRIVPASAGPAPLDRAVVDTLLAQRDHRPVTIAE